MVKDFLWWKFYPPVLLIGLSPIEASKWLEENMIPYYPLGEFRTPEEVA